MQIRCLLTNLFQAWVVCAAMTAIAAADSKPETIWVFTTQNLPELRGIELASQVFVLDDIEPPLKNLSFEHSGSETAALRRAIAILKSPRGQSLLEEIQRNAQALAQAWYFGIDKLPAVLVAGQYVVYGEYDLRTALHKVGSYRDAE